MWVAMVVVGSAAFLYFTVGAFWVDHVNFKRGMEGNDRLNFGKDRWRRYEGGRWVVKGTVADWQRFDRDRQRRLRLEREGRGRASAP